MHHSKSTLMFAIVSALGAANVGASELGEWQDYARAAVMPSFDWADRAQHTPTLYDRGAQVELQELFAFQVRNEHQKIALAVGRSAVTETPMARAVNADASFFNAGRSTLVRDLVAPSFSAETGGGVVTAGVVIAEQRFASLGMGATVVDTAEEVDRSLPVEKVAGTGVRLAYTAPISSKFSVDTFVQSRVNMEALHAYRGVFSDPGDFDIPSQAGVTVRYQFAPKWQLAVSADRIRYSELTAFSSNALPTRFLSLLGDSTSPEFAWQDLDVLGAEVSYSLNQRSGLIARYGTHQQPEPTSTLLRSALDDAIGGGFVALGYHQGTRNFGSFALNATYADTQSFLGNVSAANKDATGAQVELEASWRFDF